MYAGTLHARMHACTCCLSLLQFVASYLKTYAPSLTVFPVFKEEAFFESIRDGSCGAALLGISDAELLTAGALVHAEGEIGAKMPDAGGEGTRILPSSGMRGSIFCCRLLLPHPILKSLGCLYSVHDVL